MIYKSLLENELIDGIVQDPDEPGVDLDAVEKAIAGEDGIAAHQDEVEAAADGMIGDPVEEFAMIIYESEYNYNQIMEAIGMNELREATMGRDLVLEAADVKGFFKTIKNFFVQMFERITEAVRNVLAKLDLQAKSDKKFVTANKTHIIEGAKSDKWSIKGYNVKELDKYYNAISADYNVDDVKNLMDAVKSDDKAKVIEQVKNVQGMSKDFEKLAIKAGYGIDAENIKEFRKVFHKELFGEDKVELNKDSGITGEAIIKVLSDAREATQIRKAYNDTKKSFRNILDEIKKWEASVAKAEDSSILITGCQLCVKYLKTSRSVHSAAYSTAISAASYKRALYRKLAHEFVRVSEAKGKYKPKNESASIFDSVSIL